MVRGAALLLLSMLSAGLASAGSCGGGDDPMRWDEGFGASQCRASHERYHLHDYDADAASPATPSDDDPTAWPADQWRSDLFGGYRHDSDDRYDRRARAANARRAAVAEQPSAGNVSSPEMPLIKPAPRRAKLITVGGDLKAGPGVIRFEGHNCHGVLVLTWGKLGGKSRCYTSGRRINTPVDGASGY